MAHNVHNMTYIYYTIVIILGSNMRRVLISWGRCSLIGLLVVMSVVVVLVLLLFSIIDISHVMYMVRITAQIVSHLGSQMRTATL